MIYDLLLFIDHYKKLDRRFQLNITRLLAQLNNGDKRIQIPTHMPLPPDAIASAYLLLNDENQTRIKSHLNANHPDISSRQ